MAHALHAVDSFQLNAVRLALFHVESHQLVPWSRFFPPQPPFSGIVSDHCDMPWHDKLQAQTHA